MGTRDSRIDRYIEKAPDFAQPILAHLRELVHENCPDVAETLKWRNPAFMYHGLLAGMVAFRERCVFGLWKGSLIAGSDGAPVGIWTGKMSSLTRLSDLPPRRVLANYIRQAMKLNEEGVRLPRARPSRPKPPPRTPADLKSLLTRRKKARETWEGFSPSHRREYVEWITEARTAETRQRRVKQTVEWLEQGKPRNWKYM